MNMCLTLGMYSEDVGGKQRRHGVARKGLQACVSFKFPLSFGGKH